MATYVFPKIGHMSVADIRAGEIVDVLRPIWATKPETARRILQRLEFVFRAAIRREWRERASPTIGVRGAREHAQGGEAFPELLVLKGRAHPPDRLFRFLRRTDDE
jgi:hypothetical protein